MPNKVACTIAQSNRPAFCLVVHGLRCRSASVAAGFIGDASVLVFINSSTQSIGLQPTRQFRRQCAVYLRIDTSANLLAINQLRTANALYAQFYKRKRAEQTSQRHFSITTHFFIADFPMMSLYQLAVLLCSHSALQPILSANRKSSEI